MVRNEGDGHTEGQALLGPCCSCSGLSASPGPGWEPQGHQQPWFVRYKLPMGHTQWCKSTDGVPVASQGNLPFSAHYKILFLVSVKVKQLYEDSCLAIILVHFFSASITCPSSVPQTCLVL